MTNLTHPAPGGMRRGSQRRDRHPADPSNYLVPPAMLIASVAMGVASNLHLGIAVDMAIAVGAALFCAMLLCHVLLRAADMADRAEEEAEDRRIAKVDSPMPIAEPQSSAIEPSAIEPPAMTRAALPQHQPEASEFGRGLGALAAQDTRAATADVGNAVTLESAPVAAPPQSMAATFAEPTRESMPVLGTTALRTTALQATALHASVQAPAMPVESEMPGQRINPNAWTFRPVDLRGPADMPQTPLPQASAHPAPTQQSDVGAREASAMAAAIGALRPTLDDRPVPMATTAAAPISGDASEVDRIDGILKRLAHQIKSSAPSVGVQEIVSASPAVVADPEAPASMAAAEPDAALASAVDALRSTVEAMRHGAQASQGSGVTPAAALMTPASNTAVLTSGRAVAHASPAETRIAAVAEALAVERVDVVLSPILAIAGAEARHFEVSVRLKDAAGSLLDARAIAGGARLLPLLDAMNVRHAAGLALKLERRGRDGAVFSEVAGESLESDGFVGDVTGRYAQGIADRMVLSFAQAEMRGLGPAHFAALGDLARLGFRFAITGVADLDMDFDQLRAIGFEFVKLDAAVFLGGLPCNGIEVPASDLVRHFQEGGIEVIVCGIDDQPRRDQLLGCGVVLGQGLLYGEPRPIPVAEAAAA